MIYRRYVTSTIVPSFYLYGEPHRSVDEGFIHLEQLDDRSRPSGWTIRAHAHADLVQMFLVDSGGGTMQVEDQSLVFTAPALLLLPTGVAHGFTWISESRGMVLTLAASWLDRLVERHPDLGRVFARALMQEIDGEAMALFERETAKLQRELGWVLAGHLAAVEGALLSLLVTALRTLPQHDGEGACAPGQSAALVARFRARIEQRFRFRETICDHAAALGISEASLRAACSRIAAQSPAAMLDQRAMLEARRALLYSNLSIAQIGYAIGFSDPAYFTRFFTRHEGRSPRRYRQERAAADRTAEP